MRTVNFQIFSEKKWIETDDECRKLYQPGLDNEFFSVKFTHCYRGLNPDENEGCALSILRAQKSLKHQRYEKEVGRLYK